MENGENDIIRMVQQQEYSDEYNTLSKGEECVKASSNIASLSPFMGKNSLLRLGSRLEYAPSYDAKCTPIILKHNWIAELMARHAHCTHAHIGQEHTLSMLRKIVWICHVRLLVRRGHAPRLHQRMEPLPPCRLMAYEPPFSYVDVDMFGPILVKQGRATPKRWGCIFTCMCTRAIHLEVAPSLETYDFINVLRQFIARRGTPKEIRTNCGTNFRGAENELRDAMKIRNDNHLEDQLCQRGINWIFHPPHEPHFSGVWERLIKYVKSALKAILRGALVKDHVLRTLFVEVESILNSRPLTKSSEDASDATAITPAHLLLQRPAVVLPPGEFS